MPHILLWKYKRAIEYIEHEDYKGAVKIYESLLREPILPSYMRSQIYNDLGLISYRINHFEKAEHFLIKAIYENILYPIPYWNLIRIVEPRIQKRYKFSIIISTYNRCDMLKRCIQSLRENSYFNLEIIVVADPCQDGTIGYLEAEASREDMVVVVNPVRIGHSKSLNKGVELATGDYIAFFNDDIITMPGWDLFLVLTIDNIEEAGCGDPLIIHPDGRVQSVGVHNLYRSTHFPWIGKVPFVDTSKVVDHYIKWFPEFQTSREIDYGYIPVMKRSCFDINGYVDERFERYFIDPDQGYRIQQSGYKNIYCPQSVLIHYELSKQDMDTHLEFAMRDKERFARKWKLYDVIPVQVI